MEAIDARVGVGTGGQGASEGRQSARELEENPARQGLLDRIFIIT